jgi:hypothetical protein
MKLIKTWAAVASAMLVLAGARARAETFDWTINGPAATLGGAHDYGSGTFEATATSTPGEWLITGITGSVGNVNITGLLATGSDNNNDNLLFPGTPGITTTVIDIKGIAFETAKFDLFSFDSAGTSFNPMTTNAYGELASKDGFGVFGTFNVAAVPEPSTWAMMILGFAGIGAITYRRRKSVMLTA